MFQALEVVRIVPKSAVPIASVAPAFEVGRIVTEGSGSLEGARPRAKV